MKVRNCKKVELKFIDDGIDGNLVVAEALKQIPFEIKRVYFINNLKHNKALRGHHAHRQLEQVIFCINGSFELLLDDSRNKENIILKEPHVGICMGRGVWHTMQKFSHDCIILVLASDIYREADYIRDYPEFVKYVRNKR